MKVLLDECVPRKFKSELLGHNCKTVPELGLSGKRNGELLSLAGAAGFEVFLTLDRGLEYQQNLRDHKLAVILIRGRSSRLSDLIVHVPELLAALSSIQPGQLIRVPV
jgi:hypothetical protein